MPPQPCDVCSKCGSTLAQHPDHHAEPVPHTYEVRYDERTGAPKNRLCTRCYKTAPLAQDAKLM